MSACIFRFIPVFRCQNNSPPKHGRSLSVCVCFPMVCGCMLSDFSIILLFICVSHLTLLKFATFFPYALSLSASSIPPDFQSHGTQHISRKCCDGKHLVGSTQKFGSLTETLNRIGSFLSNGVFLLQSLSSRVVFQPIIKSFHFDSIISN